MTFRMSVEEARRRGWLDDKPSPSIAPQAKAASTRRRKSEAEGDEQAQLIAWFRLQFPALGPLLIHIPNGGSRKNAFEGWRLKQQGVRAGVSDLLLPVAKGGYFGLWIEFKATPPDDAIVSTAQQSWVDEMRSQGYRAEICKGLAPAKSLLTAYCQSPDTPRITSAAG